MATRSLPSSFPQALARDILRADAQRQASILRQEFVTELLGILADTRDTSTRSLVLKMSERHLRSGIAAAQKSEALWPETEEAREGIEKEAASKPASARKHWKLFEQLDRVHQRSLALLRDSFQHIRIILDRLESSDPKASALPPEMANTRPPPESE